MNTIQVEIVSAERALFSGEATMVVAPGKDGDLGIAPRHTPLLTSLRPGDIQVFMPEGDNKFCSATKNCRILLLFWEWMSCQKKTS